MLQATTASTSPNPSSGCHQNRLPRRCAGVYLAVGGVVCLCGVLRADPAGTLHDLTAELTKQWPANRTVNIVCHGHSVPAGYFKTPIVDTFHAYPHLLHRSLKERFPHAVLNVIVTAIGGEDSESGAKRFERDVLSLRPDVVTIDYGLNDRRIGLDRAEVAWQAMIAQAQAAGARVILLTPTPDTNANRDDPADPLNRHAGQIRRLARENGTALVDSLARFQESVRAGKPLESLMSQSNHPNREGHQIVAAELLKWFLPSSTTQIQTPATAATYRNPVIEGNLADPAVILHEGVYYLYATGEVDGDNGYRVYMSTNLVDWQRGPVVFRPGLRHIWAPDLWRDPVSGKFYLYYTANQTIGVAEGEGPLGPFTIRRKLFDSAIDAHLFRDDDGKLYLYFVQLPGFRITVQPMASPTEPAGEPRVILRPQSDWEMRAGHVTEGPWIIKHQGRYHMLYSGSGADTPDYAVGYATADSPLGPFTRAPHNPIVQRSQGVFGPGHGCAIRDGAGRWWHVYHQKRHDRVEWDRFICIDPLWFDENGNLFGRATRGTSQPAPAPVAGEPKLLSRRPSASEDPVDAEAEADGDLRRQFAEPPPRYWPRPLWFWNNTAVTVEALGDQMRQARDRCRYGGFGILPFGKEFAPAYLSEEYFTVYGAALEQAKTLGLTLSLYDEYGFPSGSAGSQNSSDTSLFAKRWPELTIKRLDKHEWEISGPARLEQALPEGQLMAVVAMNAATRQRIDLTETVRNGRLDWQAPPGSWKVMSFVCVIDGDPICDYLDPEAADRFIELTHQAYYDRFAAHFGTTIDSTFFDEPTLYRAGGRTWTDKFNQKFRARHGFDPRPYYPALWYDIGPETQAARNYLFGFRAELYAMGFTKRIQDWCDAHGITATGHQDQEEVINPVSVSGDLMKCFQHLDIPGIDKIGGNRPAERFYKIISSAAYNWDRSFVMSETYGAMGDLGWDAVYTVAMEQYTKGINLLIPHAVWYDDQKVTFKPELSWRNPLYGERLPEFNTYLARLNVLLQNDAAYVADVAVLYPIATLQGSHHLDGPLGYYQGGVAVPEADYVAVGELLAVDLGRDYTFLHPEVLEDKCVLDGKGLVLPNRIHPGRFGTLVLPGHKTIRWSSLQKIKAFYEQGGSVVATGQLPSKSAEFGHDEDVVRTIESLFGAAGPKVEGGERIAIRRNQQGGCAIHLRSLTAETLQEGLGMANQTCDVAFEPGQTLRYIHKRWNGRHIYFFANLNAEWAETTVLLRGRHDLEAWDPHTGSIQPIRGAYEIRSGTDFTRIQLPLPYRKSLFLVSARGPHGAGYVPGS